MSDNDMDMDDEPEAFVTRNMLGFEVNGSHFGAEATVRFKTLKRSVSQVLKSGTAVPVFWRKCQATVSPPLSHVCPLPSHSSSRRQAGAAAMPTDELMRILNPVQACLLSWPA